MLVSCPTRLSSYFKIPRTEKYGMRCATLNRQSSEGIVAGGESSVGEDGGVDPGQEVGDAGVHVRNVL